METLLVAQHRNQYYSRSRTHSPARFWAFGSPPSKEFREINCRTFQSGTGILPTPLQTCAAPISKQAFSPSSSPKTSSASVNSLSEGKKNLEKSFTSSAVPIPINMKIDCNKECFFSDDFSYSELWAGPAYSNSPPPSSLPIPKFSIRPKRTVSLDLPASASDINDLHLIAKSAPPSPTRERITFPRDLFHSADSATKNLRRILNLDIADA